MSCMCHGVYWLGIQCQRSCKLYFNGLVFWSLCTLYRNLNERIFLAEQTSSYFNTANCFISSAMDTSFVACLLDTMLCSSSNNVTCYNSVLMLQCNLFIAKGCYDNIMTRLTFVCINAQIRNLVSCGGWLVLW